MDNTMIIDSNIEESDI